MSPLLQNRYQICQTINRGGMGWIYLAYDHRLKTEVAIKEFGRQTFDCKSEKLYRRLVKAFESEAHLMADLSHPGIPQTIDYFYENDSQYLVMELVQGLSLEKIISTQFKNLERSQVLDWFKQIVAVLDYLHNLENPIIHRDIKPANIKVNSRGKIFVLDFGISKATLCDDSHAKNTLQFATLEFAPLEQTIQASEQIRASLLAINPRKTAVFLHEKTSVQTDVFSLAATLYRLLTGKLCLDAYNRALAIWSGKPDPLLPPSYYNHDIPSELDALIVQSMSIYPSSRPTTVSIFTETINRLERRSASFLPHAEESPTVTRYQGDSSVFLKNPHFGAYLRSLESIRTKCSRLEGELRQLNNGNNSLSFNHFNVFSNP